MTAPRVAGKYGRREPSNKPAIRFGDILRTGATIPPHPASEDYLARLTNWAMLGNDKAGNCVAVAWANFRRLVTAFLTSENYPTQDQVWTIYKTQNPDFDPNGDPNVNGPGSPADGGMDIQILLEYLVKVGGPDGVKAVAFAKVDYTQPDELDAALAIFGGVWLGIDVTQANVAEFNANQPWDYVAGSADDGGHSVLAGGYSPDPRFETWAAETSFTEAFVAHQFAEAWIVVWPEHVGTAQFEAGVDVAALAAAYQELTGSVLVVPPGPTPTPTPGPTPTPDPADTALVASTGPWAREHQQHGSHKERVVATALVTWMTTKGYA